MNTIAAEQFDLTPSIREHVEDNLAKLYTLLPESSRTRVFLSEPVRGTFRALYAVHALGKDLVAHGDSDDLYQAIIAARQHLARKLIWEHRRWVQRRRRSTA